MAKPKNYAVKIYSRSKDTTGTKSVPVFQALCSASALIFNPMFLDGKWNRCYCHVEQKDVHLFGPNFFSPSQYLCKLRGPIFFNWTLGSPFKKKILEIVRTDNFLRPYSFHCQKNIYTMDFRVLFNWTRFFILLPFKRWNEYIFRFQIKSCFKYLVIK